MSPRGGGTQQPVVPNTTGAPATITSAHLVTETPYTTKVTFCRVKGVIAPQTKFGMLLPIATYHGQYLQVGCSTLCGSVDLSPDPVAGITCGAVDNGELAIATDVRISIAGK